MLLQRFRVFTFPSAVRLKGVYVSEIWGRTMSTSDSTSAMHSSNGNNCRSSLPIDSLINAQVSPMARSVPPTGMRLTKIMGEFRKHVRSVGLQIGADSLIEFVQQVVQQDLPYEAVNSKAQEELEPTGKVISHSE